MSRTYLKLHCCNFKFTYICLMINLKRYGVFLKHNHRPGDMSEDQANLIKKLLKIRNDIWLAKNEDEICKLIDTAIDLALPVPPNCLNLDVLGYERLVQGKMLSINTMHTDKEIARAGYEMEFIKTNTVLSLVSLMLRFANGITEIQNVEHKFKLSEIKFN